MEEGLNTTAAKGVVFEKIQPIGLLPSGQSVLHSGACKCTLLGKKYSKQNYFR
jgi:hypothetical protein